MPNRTAVGSDLNAYQLDLIVVGTSRRLHLKGGTSSAKWLDNLTVWTVHQIRAISDQNPLEIQSPQRENGFGSLVKSRSNPERTEQCL